MSSLLTEPSTLSSLPFSDLLLEPDGFAWYKASPLDRKRNALVDEALSEAQALREHLVSNDIGMDERVPFGDRILRIMRQYTVRGDVYVCRDIRVEVMPFDELGLPPMLLDSLLKPRIQRGGLVIWFGQAGAGKSTSQFSFVSEYLKKFGGIAWTVENPAETMLDGPHVGPNGTVGTCYQTEIKRDSEYPEAIQRLLRAAPNLIMLGEIRTPQVAAEAVLAGMSGHVVSTTLHGSDVVTGLERLKNLVRESGLDASMIADALTAVVYQSMSMGNFAGVARRVITGSPLIIGGSATETSTRVTLRKGDYAQLKTEIQRQQNIFDGTSVGGKI
ncbi:ATPase, T2SS/T4P/T4SS family [Burkholderia sp. Ac-20365]|uniref:ATPase, T2SS/T4P/T4SS family n=1 Tax=Burkholderia sp. Ac-20365 TaxID=2703897 RepID=UPI00197C675A|nr:ATPase, T2SS/T4P/T4SS family [Burkholderia sp. Ac-20365]MBN3761072.1 Flp pilus assembly complex ATPase component [Burkholderia sp. Ac-20365]